MKRCPECEFLYEDEQNHCDMDGTRLMFTATLPALPQEAAQPKSVRGALTVSLLAAIVLAALLVTLYRATPRALSSTSTAQTQPASQQLQDANQESQVSAEDGSLPTESAPAGSPMSDDRSTDPFASRETRAQRATTSLPAVNKTAPTPAPIIHIQAASNPQVANVSNSDSKSGGNQTTGVSQPSSGNQKAATTSSSISNHPKPPAAPQPAQNANKDSKVNSFFKKAGKILKKPFDN